jgi:hypothetical protein
MPSYLHEVKKTYLGDGEVEVSTVYLPTGHLGEEIAGIPYTPIEWLTIVFVGEEIRRLKTFTSEEDAIEGHDLIVNEIRNGYYPIRGPC